MYYFLNFDFEPPKNGGARISTITWVSETVHTHSCKITNALILANSLAIAIDEP